MPIITAGLIPGETAPGVFSVIIYSIDPSFGNEEVQITIGGINFGEIQGTGCVTFFDGIVATEIDSWSNVQIICTVPSGAKTGCVSITTDNEDSNCSTFIVLNLPCPGDIDGDSDVVGTDLKVFTATYAIGDLIADLDNSGVVDVSDLAVFAGNFGWSDYNILPCQNIV